MLKRLSFKKTQKKCDPLNRISLRFIGLFAITGIALPFPAFTALGESVPIEQKGPTVITSLTLTADNNSHTALFEGAVVAKTGDMTMYSDRMLVYYTVEGKVKKIEADGHIKLLKGERIITSESAVYNADEEKLIFTGQPKAIEGNNIVSGSKMTYLIKENRSLVENSRVYMGREFSAKPAD